MKQINTLIIVTDLTLGGIQNYVRTLSNLLVEMKHKVFIIAINEAYLFEKAEVISLKDYRSFKKPLFIKRFVKKNEIDVVLDHRTKSNLVKQKVYDCILKNVPKVQFVHSANLDMYFYKTKWLNQLAYKNTKMFVSVSEYINELVQKQIKSTYEVAYYFFDLNKVSYDKNTNKQDVLFVGRFDNEVKDLDFLLNAYKDSELHSEKIKFHFVGAGKDEQLIRGFTERNKLEDFIIIHKATDDLKEFYRKAKIVVLASNFEGFPLVLLESMFNKTPVLTTFFNPSVQEIIIPNKNGIVVEKELTQFTEALKQVFHDSEFYNHLIENLSPFNTNFTKETAKIKWKTIFDNLLKNRTT